MLIITKYPPLSGFWIQIPDIADDNNFWKPELNHGSLLMNWQWDIFLGKFGTRLNFENYFV